MKTIKKYLTYVNENNMFDECFYQIGDIVKYIPYGIIGTIVNRFINKRTKEHMYLIKWIEPNKLYGHDGSSPYENIDEEIKENDYISDKNDCWWAVEYQMTPMTEEKKKKRREKEEKRKRRKEELRIRMMDVDPYGEEDWDE